MQQQGHCDHQRDVPGASHLRSRRRSGHHSGHQSHPLQCLYPLVPPLFYLNLLIIIIIIFYLLSSPILVQAWRSTEVVVLVRRPFLRHAVPHSIRPDLHLRVHPGSAEGHLFLACPFLLAPGNCLRRLHRLPQNRRSISLSFSSSRRLF